MSKKDKDDVIKRITWHGDDPVESKTEAQQVTEDTTKRAVIAATWTGDLPRGVTWSVKGNVIDNGKTYLVEMSVREIEDDR
jgi:hypothetical protein